MPIKKAASDVLCAASGEKVPPDLEGMLTSVPPSLLVMRVGPKELS